MHHGRRAVEGQRLLRATSDVLLGWDSDPTSDIHYYVRRCGWALARAHAQTRDSVSVFGYIGTSERFGESIADWVQAQADQTERDHRELLSAIERGARFTD